MIPNPSKGIFARLHASTAWVLEIGDLLLDLITVLLIGGHPASTHHQDVTNLEFDALSLGHLIQLFHGNLDSFKRIKGWVVLGCPATIIKQDSTASNTATGHMMDTKTAIGLGRTTSYFRCLDAVVELSGREMSYMAKTIPLSGRLCVEVVVAIIKCHVARHQGLVGMLDFRSAKEHRLGRLELPVEGKHSAFADVLGSLVCCKSIRVSVLCGMRQAALLALTLATRSSVSRFSVP